MTSGVLDREEYIEQAYFFRVFRERLFENVGADLGLEQTRVVHSPEVTHIRYRVDAGSPPSGAKQDG